MSDTLSKRERESPEAYLFRVGSMKETGMIDLTWSDLAPILNEALMPQGEEHDESTWRRRYKAMKSKTNSQTNVVVTDPFFDRIKSSMEEIQKERIRLKDERVHHQRIITSGARLDDLKDMMMEAIEQVEPIKPADLSKRKQDRAVYALLSDIHYGLSFSSEWNCYNPTIATERVMSYAANIVEIGQTHQASVCYVSLLGDMVSGNIHQTTRIENRENLIAQVVGVSELVAAFIKTLSENFRYVYINNVSGNHSRLDPVMEKSLRNERLDNLIPWYCKAKLAQFPNVFFEDNHYDSTFALFTIYGKHYLAFHGDMDEKPLVSAVKIGETIDKSIDYVVVGHLHIVESRFESTGLIRNGCTVGSGDEYTVRKRLFSPAMQTCMIVTEDGVQCMYPIKL